MVPLFAVFTLLAAPEPVSLSLAEAIELAVTRNNAVERGRMDQAAAKQRVEEAWSSVYPRVDATARYTRTLESADPFAGSDAGGFFESLGAIGWLAHNEAARTDGSVLTQPISFAEFQQQQAEGLAAAGGGGGGSDNPFFVPNRFDFNLGVTQTIYSARAFAALRGAEDYERVAEAGTREAARQVGTAAGREFLAALLAAAQVEVLQKSLERAQETLGESGKRGEQGVAPQFQQLSAEVEVANLQTRLIGAEAQAEAGLDGLKLRLGLPADAVVVLRGSLRVGKRLNLVEARAAGAAAASQRPDLRQAELAVRLAGTQAELTEAEWLPTVSAFLNAGFTGSVPDDRERVVSDPQNPFAFSTTEDGVFDDRFWDPALNLGVQLSWNLFDGFGSSARLERDRIEQKRAALNQRDLQRRLGNEVQQSLRALRTAERRMLTQERNIERAATNYEHARLRVAEGVSTPLEQREASQQLDDSRLFHLQAVHDYLVAWLQHEAALGTPPAEYHRVGGDP